MNGDNISLTRLSLYRALTDSSHILSMLAPTFSTEEGNFKSVYDAGAGKDEATLARMGYKQELKCVRSTYEAL